MMISFWILCGFCGLGFLSGYSHAQLWRDEGKKLAALPQSYGFMVAIRCATPFFYIHFFLWIIGAHAYLSVFHCQLLACSGSVLAWGHALFRLSAQINARIFVERRIKGVLSVFTAFVVILALGIVLVLIFEALRFFKHVSLIDFLLGLQWSPYVSSSGECLFFGAVPLMAGTALITLIAIMVAGPCGLFSAIYLSEYASLRTRKILKPFLEMLAGVPTVVYGFFAAITVAPWMNRIGSLLGLHVAMESALSAGLVMGLMILPFILSLCDDILRSVPKGLREGAWALGATPGESIRQIILPAAFPGILASFLLAISRALGETMLVVMAAGMSAHLTFNPLQAVTTVTVQIVALLTGDQEPGSPKTLAAFALGLLLFTVTLSLNMIAIRIVRKYRKNLVIR